MTERRPRATGSSSLAATSPPTGTVLARAAAGPAALLSAGAGVAIGVWAGLPAGATVALALVLWTLRMAVAMARSRPPRPRPIDPYALIEPWRHYVRDAINAGDRLHDTLARWPPGPLLERLTVVESRVGVGVDEVWRVANQAAAVDATRALTNPGDIGDRIRKVQDERRVVPAGSDRLAALDRTEASLAAQLQSARRLQAVGRQAEDRLRSLTAQLDSVVASVVELSLQLGDPSRADELSGNVDAIVADLEALRHALEEAGAEGLSPPP